MNTRIMKTILLLLTLTGAATAEEVVVEGKNLPHAFTFTTATAGYLHLHFTDRPGNFEPFLVCTAPADARVNGPGSEARLPAGEAKCTLQDRWHRQATGTIRFTIEFTAETDPSEPNDDGPQARPVQLGEPVEFAIAPAGDQDILVFDVAEAGYLVPRWEKPPPNPGDFEVRFFHDARHLLTAHLARVDLPGRLYAVVRQRWNSYSSTQPLRLVITLVPEQDPFEPNDTPEQAAPLTLGAWHQAVCAPGGDMDYFRIQVPDPGYLIFETDQGPKFAMVPALLSADGATQLQSGAVMSVAPGEYLLRLQSRYGDFSTDPYLFRVRFLEEPDELEPNDATAATLEFDRKYRVALIRPGDVDLWTVKAPGPGHIRVELTPGYPRDVAILLKQGKGPEAEVHNAAAPVRAGPVQLRMLGRYSSYSLEPFAVVVRFEPELDPHEPNDTQEAATPIQLGEVVHVILGPGTRDVDWFRLEVPEDGILYTITSEDPRYPNGAPTVQLVDASGKVVKENLNQNPRSPDRSVRISRGTWYLRVSPGYGDQEFNLTVDVAPVGEVPRRAAATAGLAFAFIGLDVDEATMAALKILARATGSTFRNAAGAEQIQEEMRTALVEATREKPIERVEPTRQRAPLWIWIGIGVITVLLVTGVAIFRATRSPSA